MTVRYHQRGQRMVPDYMCQARRIQGGGPLCQHIPGGALDDAIGKLLVDTVTPMTLEVALAVQKELESRCEETERLRNTTLNAPATNQIWLVNASCTLIPAIGW
jgi:hypothetical protein